MGSLTSKQCISIERRNQWIDLGATGRLFRNDDGVALWRHEPRFSISSCHCAMDSKFGIVAARDAEQLIDDDFRLAALDGHSPKSTGSDAVRHLVVDILGDADRGAELLVQSLDSRSNVHTVAHHSIAQPSVGTDIADNDGVAMHADPYPHLLATFGRPACIEPHHTATGL